MANVCSHRKITVDLNSKVTNMLGRLKSGARYKALVGGKLLTTTSTVHVSWAKNE